MQARVQLTLTAARAVSGTGPPGVDRGRVPESAGCCVVSVQETALARVHGCGLPQEWRRLQRTVGQPSFVGKIPSWSRGGCLYVFRQARRGVLGS